MVTIRKSDLKAKNPKAILKYLFAMSPEKVIKLAEAQGVLIESMEDVANLGDELLNKETDFNLKRFVKSLTLTSDEILNSRRNVELV